MVVVVRAVLKFVILSRVDSEGSNTMLNCLMYKMCYYRFGQVYTEGGETHTHTADCVYTALSQAGLLVMTG